MIRRTHVRVCCLLFFVSLLFAGCQTIPNTSMIDQLLHEAKSQWAPDSRTVLFDVTSTIESDAIVLHGEIQGEELHGRLMKFLKEKYSGPIVDKLTVLPAAELKGKEYGVVSLSVANIRTKPQHEAEMGTQAIMGTPVRILKKSHGWLLVQTPDKYLGWSDDEITMMDHETFTAWQQAPKVIVTSTYGFTRESKAPDAAIVSDVVAGSIFALKSDAGSHWEVAYPDGRTGFLAKSDGAPFDRWLAQSSDTPENILATARRFNGIPYLWGGTSTKGMDCSGFTKTVFFLNGVILPRDASQQAVVGTPVPADTTHLELSPGDLLFFGSKATEDKPARVTHVGISLGGARFIHESGYVHVNSLNPADKDYSRFRDQTFLWARRMIGENQDAGVQRIAASPYVP